MWWMQRCDGMAPTHLTAPNPSRAFHTCSRTHEGHFSHSFACSHRGAIVVDVAKLSDGDLIELKKKTPRCSQSPPALTHSHSGSEPQAGMQSEFPASLRIHMCNREARTVGRLEGRADLAAADDSAASQQHQRSEPLQTMSVRLDWIAGVRARSLDAHAPCRCCGLAAAA